MKVFYIIIIITLLMCSCVESERETVLSGQVVDRQTGLPLTEVCLAFSGYNKAGFLQPEEGVSIHYTSVDSNGRFNLKIIKEEVSFYSTTLYRKNEGYCSTSPIEMEILYFECKRSDCRDLIRPGRKHDFLIEVFDPSGI